MFTRTTGFLIVPLWMLAMSWVVAHDVWPGFTALPSPPLKLSEGLIRTGLKSRFSILADGGAMGTVWSQYNVDPRSVTREDLIWIDRLPAPITPLRINVYSVFTAEGTLDEVTVRVQNPDVDLRLHGERFHSDFSFTLEGGAVEKTFKVPLTDGDFLGGAFHPFSAMTDLRVGQRWRMQGLNPIAWVTGVGRRFLPMLIEVTGEERITTATGDHNCLVVESSDAKAWVDAEGTVWVQEVKLPMLGRLRIQREAEFDEPLRHRTRNRSFHAP